MSNWEIRKNDRHVKGFLTEEITVGKVKHSIFCKIYSKSSPNMGGDNFIWSVQCKKLQIHGEASSFCRSQELVESSITHIIDLYNKLYN